MLTAFRRRGSGIGRSISSRWVGGQGSWLPVWSLQSWPCPMREALVDVEVPFSVKSIGRSTKHKALYEYSHGDTLEQIGRRGLFNLTPSGGRKAEMEGKEYHERKLLNFSPEELYEVVLDIDSYDKFVPWCERSRVIHHEKPGFLEAEMVVGFKVISEKYISRVHYQRPNFVNAYSSESSLFEYLENNWSFVPGPNPNSCYIDFKVKFKFRSHTYQELVNYIFESLAERMISSFENRCKYVYNRTSSAYS